MEKSTRNQIEKLTIGLKVMERILHTGQFTRRKTVAASKRNRKNMKTGRRNTIMTPTTEIRTTASPDIIM